MTPLILSQDGDGPPSRNELLDEVEKHRQVGISAAELSKTFASKGYHPYKIQRAIQHALDRGELELGDRLRLVAAARVAA
jgi:hypothetical protein